MNSQFGPPPVARSHSRYLGFIVVSSSAASAAVTVSGRPAARHARLVGVVWVHVGESLSLVVCRIVASIAERVVVVRLTHDAIMGPTVAHVNIP